MYPVHAMSGDFQSKPLFMAFEAFPSPVSAYWDSAGFLFCLKFHLKTYLSMERGGVEPAPGFPALRMCFGEVSERLGWWNGAS